MTTPQLANLTVLMGHSKLNRPQFSGGRVPQNSLGGGIPLNFNMLSQAFGRSGFWQCLCLLMVGLVAGTSVRTALAQGAVQAVRQRVSGLPGADAGPPGTEAPTGREGQPGFYSPGSLGSSVGKLDTSYVSSTASVIVSLRPAQILASPLAQTFPIEVVTAAGQKYLGIDPAEIDEVIAFVDMANPMAPAYGAKVKFKNQFRASVIPENVRAHAQLAELNGKKYLKSASPMMPSFYGPNNKTLVLAPDAMMQKIVPAAKEPKSGTLIDRTREVPSGSDFYLAINVEALRPLVQMTMAQPQAAAKVPPEAKQYLDMLNIVAAAELTLNLTTTGSTTLVVHGSDDAAAGQIETMVQQALEKYRTPAIAATEQPMPEDAVSQAMTRFKQRISMPFQPQRNGTGVTCMHFDGQDPAQRQMVMALVAIASSQLVPAIEKAKAEAMKAQTGGAPGAPPAGVDPSAAPPAGNDPVLAAPPQPSAEPPAGERR
jgi:hypothetical protein